MFILYYMSRQIRIDPINLEIDRVDAVTDEINRRFANKVLLGVGLGVALWDIEAIKEGKIFQGDGGVHLEVTFRYIIFRPYHDEIILGKIKNCTSEGIHVTLGFFDDIIIPAESLQFPSKFDEREQLWIWEYQPDEAEEKHEMFMDKGETIRFRVTAEHFNDTTPTFLESKNQPPPSPTKNPGPSTFIQNDENPAPKIPYQIVGSINEPGLGILSWWN